MKTKLEKYFTVIYILLTGIGSILWTISFIAGMKSTIGIVLISSISVTVTISNLSCFLMHGWHYHTRTTQSQMVFGFYIFAINVSSLVICTMGAVVFAEKAYYYPLAIGWALSALTSMIFKTFFIPFFMLIRKENTAKIIQ